jgi:hypothetical protein
VNCNRAKELLALYAGGDLTEAEALRVEQHTRGCQECRRFYEGLSRNRTLIGSLRPEAVSPAMLTEMRRELYSRLDEAHKRLGWWVRLERFLLIEFRRPRYAVAGLAIAVIVSVTLLAQLRHVAANPGGVIFESADTLRLPENYRDWILVSGAISPGPHPGEPDVVAENRHMVYMSPSAYREFRRTGLFPEGTVMVLEATNTVAASVKDHRFGGWGYFQFTQEDGRLSSRAQVLPESANCMACHRDRAATDHVFTQFYPVLRSASGVL